MTGNIEHKKIWLYKYRKVSEQKIETDNSFPSDAVNWEALTNCLSISTFYILSSKIQVLFGEAT